MYQKLLNSAALLATVLGAGDAFALSIGQVDTFEDGTTQNWGVSVLGAPHPAPPANINTGGPAGAGDNYLQLTSVGGAGPGSRLTAFNFGSQWAGDYTDAGISLIRLDVNNLGNTDLALRLEFLVLDQTGNPQHLAISTNAVALNANSGWQSIAFPILSTDLFSLAGSVEAALAGNQALRIFHNPLQGFPGPANVAILGIDNIAAVPIPPALWLLGTGVMMILGRGRSTSIRTTLGSI
jgi:hypothetical protein